MPAAQEVVVDLEYRPTAGACPTDYTTVQRRITGTFSGGPFYGVHATGRRVDLRGIGVMPIVDGLLVDNTNYHDMLAVALQIGMLPCAGSRGDRDHDGRHVQ